jgi:hypothetical protein
MPPTIPEPLFGGFDFGSEFLQAVDFGGAFDFSAKFLFLPEVDFLDTSSLGDEAFEYDDVSCNFSVKSIISLRSQDQKCLHWKKRSKNCTSYREILRSSCWYIKFLAPGPV